LKTALTMGKTRRGRWGMTFTLLVGDEQLKGQTQRSDLTKVRQGNKQVHPNTSTPLTVSGDVFLCLFVHFLIPVGFESSFPDMKTGGMGF